MTDYTTHLDIKTHEQIERVRDRLADLRRRPLPTAGELDARFEVLDARLDTSRTRLAQSQDIIGNWEGATPGELQSWKQDRQIEKLKEESTKCRQHADAAIDVALTALDEAEAAMIAAAVAQDSAETIAPERFLDD